MRSHTPLVVLVLLAAGCSSSASQNEARAPDPMGETAPAAQPSAPAGEAVPATAPGQTAPTAAVADEDRPGIAVFRFDNGGSYGRDAEDFEALRIGLQQMLLTELAQNGTLRIVERTQLAEILEEQDLGADGRVEARTAAEIGRLVGARYVVTGSFVDWYGDFRIDARIYDVETSEILRSEQVRAERRHLYRLLVDLAGQVTAGVDLPPLPPRERDARRSRDLPDEALTLYSRALMAQGQGWTDQAIDLYRRIAREFPQMTEASEALRQLQTG